MRVTRPPLPISVISAFVFVALSIPIGAIFLVESVYTWHSVKQRILIRNAATYSEELQQLANAFGPSRVAEEVRALHLTKRVLNYALYDTSMDRFVEKSYSGFLPPEVTDLIKHVKNEGKANLVSDVLVVSLRPYPLVIVLDPNITRADVLFNDVLAPDLLGLRVISLIAFLLFCVFATRRALQDFELSQHGIFFRIDFDKKPKSKEGDVILANLRGRTKVAKKFKKVAETLAKQVQPAMKKLMNTRNPPYEFLGHMVRTDINNYTELVKGPHSEAFKKRMDQFFVEVGELVNRYGGLVCDFVGDEIIYFFEDEPEGSTFQKALDAAREVNEIAERINSETQVLGFSFFIKSGIASEQMRFGRHLTGYNLSGDPFITTVRLLEYAKNKSVNEILIADDRILELRDDQIIDSLGMLPLKGLALPRLVSKFIRSNSIEEQLRQLEEAVESGRFIHPKDVIVYRSDRAIVTIANFMATRFYGDKTHVQLLVIRIMRKMVCFAPNPSVTKAMNTWLDGVYSRTHQGKETDTNSWAVASALVTLYPCIVPREGLNDESLQLLHLLLKSPNERVRSNAFEAFGRYGIAPEGIDLKAAIKSKNNREAANALILFGVQNYDQFIHRELERMISGRGQWWEFFMKQRITDRSASGLYALGEICRTMAESDPVAYHTSYQLQKLVKWAERLSEHSNLMVAKQARIALLKSNPDLFNCNYEDEGNRWIKELEEKQRKEKAQAVA